MIMDTQLEEMRQQMAVLKEKLEKQEIINDQLMRNTIGTKLRKFKVEQRRKIIFIVLGLIYIPAILYYLLHTALWFIILTVVFFAGAGLYDTYYTWGINDEDLQNKRLLETRERIIVMKRMNARWLWFSIPFVIVWFILFVWQVYSNDSELHAAGGTTPLIIGAVVGGVIGGLIGMAKYKKQQRRATELIEEIEELTKCDEIL